MASLGINLDPNWSDNVKMAKLLCPTTAKAAKTVNKFIFVLEKSRKLLDEGTPIDQLGHRNPPVPLDQESNVYDSDSDRSLLLGSVDSEFFESSGDEQDIS